MIDMRSPALPNKLRRAVWPWAEGQVMRSLLSGLLFGVLGSISTVLVCVHGLR